MLKERSTSSTVLPPSMPPRTRSSVSPASSSSAATQSSPGPPAPPPGPAGRRRGQVHLPGVLERRVEQARDEARGPAGAGVDADLLRPGAGKLHLHPALHPGGGRRRQGQVDHPLAQLEAPRGQRRRQRRRLQQHPAAARGDLAGRQQLPGAAIHEPRLRPAGQGHRHHLPRTSPSPAWRATAPVAGSAGSGTGREGTCNSRAQVPLAGGPAIAQQRQRPRPGPAAVLHRDRVPLVGRDLPQDHQALSRRLPQDPQRHQARGQLRRLPPAAGQDQPAGRGEGVVRRRRPRQRAQEERQQEQRRQAPLEGKARCRHGSSI